MARRDITEDVAHWTAEDLRTFIAWLYQHYKFDLADIREWERIRMPERTKKRR